MTDPIGDAIQRSAQTVQAPPALRESLATRPPRRPRRGLRWGLALGGGVAAALVVVLALALGPSGRPSVQAVATAALNAPTAPAPGRHDGYLDAELAGIHFPDYEAEWGWKAIGQRTDTVEGREALTVIYTQGDTGVHYTVVDGAALDPPADAERAEVNGTEVWLQRDGETLTASWEVDGHTCVLATTTATPQQLLELVDWA